MTIKRTTPDKKTKSNDKFIWKKGDVTIYNSLNDFRKKSQKSKKKRK